MKISKQWNLKEELIKYCKDDVELLAKSIYAFRKIIYELFDTDPFRYVTLASLSMDIFRNKFLKDHSIVANSNRNQSVESREWLYHIDDPYFKHEYPITLNVDTDNEYYSDGLHKFAVDGFNSRRILFMNTMVVIIRVAPVVVKINMKQN